MSIFICIATPDPSLTTTTPAEQAIIVTPQSNCGICKGALPEQNTFNPNTCSCYLPQYWSGNECVPQSECPCFEGHMSYPVGETYRTENCDECICKIGGIPECVPKTCPPCPKGKKRVAPGTCNCKCEKCPVDTVICETSGQCIPESSWCDGIQDCPDDEVACLKTEAPSITIHKVENISE